MKTIQMPAATPIYAASIPRCGSSTLIHPDVDTADRGGMDALAVRFRRFNRFNTDDADGALLPRFAFPDRFRQLDDEMVVESKADLFDFVTAVSAADWVRVKSVRIARHLSPPSTVRLEGLVVGVRACLRR